jgi:hypothetical protein
MYNSLKEPSAVFELETLTPDTHPAVFSRESDSRVSSKYSHIDTDLIVNAVKPMGWEPVLLKNSRRNQRGLSSGRSKNTVKHMLRFRNVNDVAALEKNLGVPEIVLVNSHDRTSAIKFSLGWYELICSNGLVAMKDGCSFSLRHIHITTEKVVEIVTKLVNRFPEIAADRERYQKIDLTHTQALDFARDAARIRFSPAVQLNYNDLLTAAYSEQRDLSLWNVFNNVQRNLMNGGFTITRQSEDRLRVRKVRRINSVDMTMDVNGQLWQLLEQTANEVN